MNQNEIQTKLTSWQNAGAAFKQDQAALEVAVNTYGPKSREAMEATKRTATSKSALDATKAAYDAAVGGPVNALPSNTVSAQPKKYSGKLQNFRSDRDAFNFGLYLHAIAMESSAPAYRQDVLNKLQARGIDMHGLQTRALSEASNAQGGYLVPVEFQDTIIELIEQFGVFRGNARIMPMTSDLLTIPRYHQMPTAYWQSENSAITESSSQSLNNIQITAQTLAVLLYWSNQLGEDALVNLGDYFAGLAAQQMAYKEDAAAFLGDGTSTYGNVVGLKTAFSKVANNPGVYTATSGSASSWAAITKADITGWIGKLRVYPGAQNKIYCSSAFYSQVLLNLMLSGGGNTFQTIEAGVGDSMSQYKRMFMGYEVVVTEVMPFSATGADAVAYFGDLSKAAMLGERRATTVATSREAGNAFANNQTVMRIDQRIGINVHDVGGYTLDPAGTLIAGPIVQLLTA